MAKPLSAERMKVLHSTAELAGIEGPVHLALGVFDGLHCGHREVIGRALKAAAAGGGSAGVLTFNPHPAAVLAPGKQPKAIHSRQQRNHLLAKMGVGFLLDLPFDHCRAKQPAADFILELLDHAKPLARIAVGEDFVFGYRRTGNITMLQAMGREHDFVVEAVPIVERDGIRVSSTRLREAISQADFKTCAVLLGGPYTLFGKVMEGRKLAGQWGFPTANVPLLQEQLPPFGVYAVGVEIDGRKMTGVANLGIRPTVDSQRQTPILEVHLFDFDRELYGAELEVRFFAQLRTERRFANTDELRAQIEKDLKQARGFFSAKAAGKG